MHSGSFCPRVAAQVRATDAVQRAIGELTGGAATLLVHEQRSWASVTFQGTRHRMTWAFDRENEIAHGEAMISLLPDHEFSIPGQLVADAAIVRVDQRATPPRLEVDLELLLLEEA